MSKLLFPIFILSVASAIWLSKKIQCRRIKSEREAHEAWRDMPYLSDEWLENEQIRNEVLIEGWQDIADNVDNVRPIFSIEE